MSNQGSEKCRKEGHIIICGLGHVGYWVLNLLDQLGERVVVITEETHPDYRKSAKLQFEVLTGDARDDRLLKSAGIEKAKAIIAVTDDDMANVSIAIDAKRFNPNITVVARFFDQDLAAHLEKSINIHRALSTSALAAPASTSRISRVPVAVPSLVQSSRPCVPSSAVKNRASPLTVN